MFKLRLKRNSRTYVNTVVIAIFKGNIVLLCCFGVSGVSYCCVVGRGFMSLSQYHGV